MDDHSLFRSGIKALLDQEPDLWVAAEAEDGETAVALAEEVRPDMILMDINMPGMGGLEATRTIKERLPNARIIMLTASDEEDLLLDAIKAGAQGYLVKSIEPSEFIRQIHAYLRGEGIISSDVAVRILRIVGERENELVFSHLTQRELEVLGLVGEGATNREIAHHLAIAENTVKNHLRNILQKLHFANRVQAAAYAIRQGLVKRRS